MACRKNSRILFQEKAHIEKQVFLHQNVNIIPSLINQIRCFIAISQSGETADTLKAIRFARTRPNSYCF